MKASRLRLLQWDLGSPRDQGGGALEGKVGDLIPPKENGIPEFSSCEKRELLRG